MYKQNKMTATSIKRNTSYEAETIEAKVRRIMNNGEPIEDSAPMIYTERKDGVNPDTDIRTDKWEYAVEGMKKVSEIYKGERTERQKLADEALKNMNKENEEQQS